MEIAVPDTEVAAQFEHLLARALAGEPVVILRAGQPVARLAAMAPALGGFAHRGAAAPEVFAPEPDDALVPG